MEGVLEGDDGGPACRVARDLHRILDRLRARVDQHHLLVDCSGRDFAEALGQAHVRLVHQHVEGGVKHPARLLPDRLHHLGMVGARVERADAAGEIDVPVAVDVGNGGARRRSGEDRMLLIEAAGDILLAQLHQLSGSRAGDR